MAAPRTGACRWCVAQGATATTVAGCGLNYCMHKGFVMLASVEGEGRCSKPTVEVSMPHINCTKDATAFVALTSAELEHKAWIGFGLHIQAELRGGAFGFFPNHDPPIVEHGGFHHHSGESIDTFPSNLSELMP